MKKIEKQKLSWTGNLAHLEDYSWIIRLTKLTPRGEKRNWGKQHNTKMVGKIR